MSTNGQKTYSEFYTCPANLEKLAICLLILILIVISVWCVFVIVIITIINIVTIYYLYYCYFYLSLFFFLSSPNQYLFKIFFLYLYFFSW